MSALLSIKNLQAQVDGKEILKGISLQVQAGEVHAIMGPNGSGKSSLSNVLMGREGYEVTQGQLLFEGQDLLPLSVEERARLGLFLAFQYPVVIPGVANINFLKAAMNASRKAQNKPPLDAMDFLNAVREKMKLLNIDESFLYRPLNEGFSGGEKKRNEILQLSLLEPKLAVLDEVDSGLDIDALKIVADGVNHLRGPDRAFIVITHYQRLLDYIQPDYVHVLSHGKIIKSGDKSLAHELEKQGYGDWLSQAGEETHV